MSDRCRILVSVALSLVVGFSLLSAQTNLRVAVLDFQNLTGRSDMIYLEKAIPQIMMTDLALCEKITVIERARLQEILNEMQLALSGVIDEASAVKIGELAGANAIMVGSLIVGGSTYRIDARLVDVATGQIILADMKDWLSEDEIIRGTDELAQQIIRNLTGETVEVVTDAPVETPVYFADKTLFVETALDQPVWLNGSDRPLYLQIDIYSKEIPRRERIPLNIALVLDRSGSMASEDKLVQVKNAARFIVDNLDKNDILSLVTYESSVQTVVPAQAITNKRKIMALIDQITPGGSTNLSGGMLQGYAEVAKNLKPGQVNRVLLLSDGLANTGITNSEKLQEICREKEGQGIAISSFGVGADYDEDMLQGLADRGRGNYYFIASSEQISPIFSKEMTGLLAMAAQNVRLELNTVPGISVTDVIGFTYNSNKKSSSVALGDIFSNDHLTVTVQLRVTGKLADSQDAANLTLFYDDVAGQGERIKTDIPIRIQGTSDVNQMEQYRNPRVGGRIAFVESAREVESVIVAAEFRTVENTRAELDQQMQRVASSAARYKSTELKKQVLAIAKFDQELMAASGEVVQSLTSPNDVQVSAEKMGTMRKATKYESYQAERGRAIKGQEFQFIPGKSPDVEPLPPDKKSPQPEPQPKLPTPTILPLPVSNNPETPATPKKTEPETKPVRKTEIKSEQSQTREVPKAANKPKTAEIKKAEEPKKETPAPVKKTEVKESKPAETDTKTTESTKNEPETKLKDKKTVTAN